MEYKLLLKILKEAKKPKNPKKKTLFSPLPCHKHQFLILKSSSPNKNLSLH